MSSPDPFEQLRSRIRDVDLPAGGNRADWRVDIDTLLGLHARWLFARVKAAVRPRPATLHGRHGEQIESEVVTVADLHDLLDDQEARHP